MLMAMVVLIILVLVVSKIVDFSAQLSDTTARNADSGIEAKQVLDRIGADIAGMVIRPDVDQFYYSGTSSAGENDKMFFYSQQTGFFNSSTTTIINYYLTNQSPVSLVGYRINTTDNPSGLPSLERLSRGLTAGPDNASGGPYTAPLQYLSFFPATNAAPTSTAYQLAQGGSITNVWGNDQGQSFQDVGSLGGNYDDGVSSYYHIIGSDVFRFEVCFQIQNGTSSPIYSLYPGYTNYAPVYPACITNNLAIVVAVAVLDAKSRQLVPAASWSKMIAALPDPTSQNLATNGLMSVVWNNALQQSTFASTAGIPAPAASHIKVYQRFYYLNAPKNQ